jgi:hypothetical protein
MLNPNTLPEDLSLMDLYDLALHEVAHLWEQHHGEKFTQVESNMRRSIRRWLTEREIEKYIGSV